MCQTCTRISNKLADIPEGEVLFTITAKKTSDSEMSCEGHFEATECFLESSSPISMLWIMRSLLIGIGEGCEIPQFVTEAILSGEVDGEMLCVVPNL